MKRYSATAGALAALALVLTGCDGASGSGTVTVAVSAPATTAPSGTNPGNAGATGGSPTNSVGAPNNSGGASGNSGNPAGDSGGAPADSGPGNGGSTVTTSAASNPGTTKCATSQLTLDKGVGGPTAGHWFLRLVNHSGTSCVLQGYPGVSYTNGPTGDPVGEPADRDPATPVTAVTIAPQAAAQFEFIENTAAVNQCGDTVRSDTIRVYPPDNTESLSLNWPKLLCASPVHMLSVRAVTPM